MDKDSPPETNKEWRGVSISEICKGKGHWSFSVSPIRPSKYHSVLYELPVTLQSPPKPHHSSQPKLWDDDHVRMPHSEKNLFPVDENGTNVIKKRWNLIKDTLSSTKITSSYEFEAAVSKYNSSLPKFEALHYLFNEELDKEESDGFFACLLPKIIALALRLPELLPDGIPLLKQNHNRSLSISQLQIACLLANAFLCTFPSKKTDSAAWPPGINFVGLFSSFARPKRKQCVCEKLKCLSNYFRRVVNQCPLGVVTFERKIIPGSSMPRWDKLENNLGDTKIHVTPTGTIEDDGLGFLQVDFANKNVGGGVLRYGCVQEEIRFVICPELIVSRLFVEQLGNGEALIITGVERYSKYEGYGDTFEWKDDCADDTPSDVYGRKRTSICVIDATRFVRAKEQFKSSLILRELNKAYVGFSSRETENLAPVATGNWGCGAFNGSRQLKTLIQLMACSAANRDLVYYSFGDKELMENFYQMHLFFAANKITIAQLWRYLCKFSSANLNEDKLYFFIQQAHFDSKNQPTISKFFKKTNVESSIPSTSSMEVNSTPELSDKTNNEESMDVDVSIGLSSSEDLIESSQPESPRNYKPLEKLKKKTSPKSIASKLPKTDIGAILDALDGNANTPKTEPKSPEPPPAVFDQYIQIDLNKDTTTPSREGSTKQGKNVNKKITDFFSKPNK